MKIKLSKKFDNVYKNIVHKYLRNTILIITKFIMKPTYIRILKIERLKRSRRFLNSSKRIRIRRPVRPKRIKIRRFFNSRRPRFFKRRKLLRHYYFTQIKRRKISSRLKKRKKKKKVRRRKINILLRLKKRLKKAFKNSIKAIKSINRFRNYPMRSYFRTFVLRRSFKKIFFSPRLKKPINEDVWYNIFNYTRNSIRGYERHLKYKFFYKPAPFYKPLSKRALCFALISVKVKRKNMFVTVFLINHNKIYSKKVVFKATTGSIGFFGRKKRAKYAKEKLCNTTAKFLAHTQMTHVDITLKAGLGRSSPYLLKGFLLNPLVVRYVCVMKRRSHGYTRKRKAKRK